MYNMTKVNKKLKEENKDYEIDNICSDAISLVKDKGKEVKKIKGCNINALVKDNLKIHVLYERIIDRPLRICVYIQLTDTDEKKWLKVFDWSKNKKIETKYIEGGWKESLSDSLYIQSSQLSLDNLYTKSKNNTNFEVHGFYDHRLPFEEF